jgi:hypothetical protein|tara:strand:+ start:58 stop:249 length:192 start_codon:yes stop_codon:yes gene_type:complete
MDATDNWVQFQDELFRTCFDYVKRDHKNNFNAIDDHEKWCIKEILKIVDMGDLSNEILNGDKN